MSGSIKYVKTGLVLGLEFLLHKLVNVVDKTDSLISSTPHYISFKEFRVFLLIPKHPIMSFIKHPKRFRYLIVPESYLSSCHQIKKK